jgi:hypothetical protein
VQAEQGEPVAEHIVHLTGYPRALLVARLLDSETLLGLGPFGPVGQRTQQLAPRAEVHAEADHGGDRERSDNRLPEFRLGSRHDVDGNQHTDDRCHRAKRPTHGEAEDRDDGRAGRHRREGGDRGDEQRDADGPSAAEPEGEAAQRAGYYVGDQHARRDVGLR